jgi:hypothetical protein
MTVSPWLEPVYDSISEITESLPVRLSDLTDLLATGNVGTTGTLQYDLWEDELDSCPSR